MHLKILYNIDNIKLKQYILNVDNNMFNIDHTLNK